MNNNGQVDANTQALLDKIAELEAKVARKAPSAGIKIAAKGGISVYGLGKFPVTLYSSQWQRLLERGPEIQEFLVANRGKYAEKA
jgi:hypothetical protein